MNESFSADHRYPKTRSVIIIKNLTSACKGYFTSLNTLECNESTLCSLSNALNIPLVVSDNRSKFESTAVPDCV